MFENIKEQLKKYPHHSEGIDSDGMAFQVQGPEFQVLKVIASWGDGWNHVSVSLPNRVPTWEEMCFIKNITFGKESMAIQYHPPEKDYINIHPFVLHLWEPHGQYIPTPPTYMV